MEEDIKTQNLEFREMLNANFNNSPEEDDGSWILDLIDLVWIGKLARAIADLKQKKC